MKRRLWATTGWVALLLLALALVSGTSLADADGFGIPWHTVDAGGGASRGGPYTLRRTAGQHDAGRPLAGGGYTLSGGFGVPQGEVPLRPPLFLPLTLTVHRTAGLP